MAYTDTQLYINGEWQHAVERRSLPVHNPASGSEVARVAHASRGDLDRALASAQNGFETWRDFTPTERSKIMRKAADLMRNRADLIASLVTTEQGKPLGEATAEALAAADIIDWFADEGLRNYGRLVPHRTNMAVRQMVVKDLVGPVAAFTPWNFPINQVVRKVAHLITRPIIRKMTFTGSTPVGKQLASVTGKHMKRVSMELGGHAPAIVCDDADIELSINCIALAKFRNAGQVCIAPTGFLGICRNKAFCDADGP